MVSDSHHFAFLADLDHRLRLTLSPTTVACFVAVLYVFGLTLYRLYLHPLAKFPGPKLAALTSWYEAYYEIILNGQYSTKISELHDKYGAPNLLFVFVRPAMVQFHTRKLTIPRTHHPRHPS